MRFERFKNKRGVKLKNICNFILYSKYKKKIVIKRTTKTNCEEEINCRGWLIFLKGLA